MSGIVFAKNSGLNNEVFGKSAEPIKAIIVQGVESWEEKSLIDKIFYMDTTENFAEKYATMTAVGNFKNVGENGATPKSSMQMGFVKVIEPDTWKNSLEISAEMMEDEKLGDVKNAARRFTQSFGRTRENFAATLLANGTELTMTYDGVLYEIACADGKPMFNTAHPSKTQGTKYVQSNLFKGELNEENTYMLVTVTVPKQVEEFSVNLKAPIVVNMDNRKGVQLIVEDDYPVKYKVYDVLNQKKEDR